MQSPLEQRYLRTEDFESRVFGLEFPTEVWSVLAQLEAPISARDLAPKVELTPEVVHDAFLKLTAARLVKPEATATTTGSAAPTMGWQQFAAKRPTTASTPATPPPAAVAPVTTPAPKLAPTKPSAATAAAPVPPAAPVAPTAAARPANPTPVAPVVAAPTAPKPAAPAPVAAVAVETKPANAAIVSVRITAPNWTPPAAAQISLRLVGKAAPAAPTTGRKLKPALDAISASAGGGVPGQLLVYKVFLQIPPDLLKAAGIQSPNSVDENLVIADPKLWQALVASAQTNAKLDLAKLTAA